MSAHFATLWESIADIVPEQDAVVQGGRRICWREYEQRAARLVSAFMDAGLERHSKVGMYLYNSPEYCETNFAALKMGAVPVNVNYRYLDEELRYLLDNADAEAVVYHASLGERIASVAPPHRRPERARRPRRSSAPPRECSRATSFRASSSSSSASRARRTARPTTPRLVRRSNRHIDEVAADRVTSSPGAAHWRALQ